MISPQLSQCTRKRMIYTFLLISMCVIFHVWIMQDVLRLVDNITSVISLARRYTKVNDTIKYILIWKRYYLMTIIEGNKYLSNSSCPANNCRFTTNSKMFGDDTSLFDAIIFEAEISSKKDIPLKRTNSQLYIFATIESSYNIPACELYNENFFNWTFTYRLDSDIPWTYFVVRNRDHVIIAPKAAVHWSTSADPIAPEIKSILKKKKKAAAWLVSHCKSDSFRDEYLSKLQNHLYHYSLKIDIFGKCSKNNCLNYDCEKMIKNEYYFYMAFENSFATDYVTEKVLHGYHNYAVPVVYGGANYSRFLPPDSYVNAMGVHPYNLAYTIYEAVKNQEIFENYFRWTNLYTIDSDPKIYNPLCNLCKALNSERALHAPARNEFRLWWNGRNGMKWCLPEGYWNETAKVNIDADHIFTLY